MLLRKSTILAIAFAGAFTGVSAMAGYGMTRAADPASALTMKPLQGVSFDIGTKRAVSYFLSDNGACKLTLTLAEVVQDDEVNGLTAARMTVAVEGDKVAHFDTAEGKSLEFKCQAGAQAMSVTVTVTPDQFCNELVESSKQLNDFVAKYAKNSSVILTRENCMAVMNMKKAAAATAPTPQP